MGGCMETSKQNLKQIRSLNDLRVQPSSRVGLDQPKKHSHKLSHTKTQPKLHYHHESQRKEQLLRQQAGKKAKIKHGRNQHQNQYEMVKKIIAERLNNPNQKLSSEKTPGLNDKNQNLVNQNPPLAIQKIKYQDRIRKRVRNGQINQKHDLKDQKQDRQNKNTPDEDLFTSRIYDTPNPNPEIPQNPYVLDTKKVQCNLIPQKQQKSSTGGSKTSSSLQEYAKHFQKEHQLIEVSEKQDLKYPQNRYIIKSKNENLGKIVSSQIEKIQSFDLSKDEKKRTKTNIEENSQLF